MDGSVDVNIKKGYPVLNNNEKLTEKSITLAQEYLGENQVKMLDTRMTSEDFAYFSHQLPAVFYRLGTSANPKEEYFPLHSAQFNIDENGLKTGMGLMAYIAYNLLKE